MITRFWLAPRRRDMSVEQFQQHWLAHGPLGLSLPGVSRYQQNHGVTRDGRYLLPYPGFDACAELTWESLADMDAAISAPQNTRDSAEDEESFLAPEHFGLMITEPRVCVDGEPSEGAVRLMTFLRRHSRATTEECAEAVTGAYTRAAGALRPLRHEQFITVVSAHDEGRGPAAFDAMDALWFGSIDEALGALASPEYQDALMHLAGRAQGSERVLSRPVRMR